MRPPAVRRGDRRAAAAGRSAAVLLIPPALVAALMMTLTLLAAGGAPAASPVGMLDAGAAVRWGVPAGRLLLDLSAILAVGSLLVAVAFAPDGFAPTGRGRAAMRAAAAWSAAWAATAVAVAAFTVWDVSGVPPQNFPAGQLISAALLLAPTRALLLVAALAAATGAVAAAVAAGRGGRPHALAALALALLALTPVLYAGHSVHGANEQVASGALVVHVVAATVWLGGLAGLAVHFRASDPALPSAAEKFSSLALLSFCALTVTGVLTAFAGLGVSPRLWVSPYGAVVVVKVVAAVALGAIGWTHRRWTLPQLRAGRPGVFVRLVAVELVVMGATVGVAVALSRTPGASATGFLERANRSAGVVTDVPAVPVSHLVTDWRPEPVLTAVVVVALVAYLRRVRCAADLGPAWPDRRQGFAVAAALVATVAFGLPAGYDAGPLLAVQTLQHLLLVLVVPALAAMSGAEALGRRLRGAPVEVATGARVLRSPTTGFLAVVASTVAVLSNPLQPYSTSNAPGRVFSLVLSLAAGLVFCRSVLGLDPGARVRSARERAQVLVMVALYLVGFGVVLANRSAGADRAAVELASVTAAQLLWAGLVVLGPPAVVALHRQLRRERERAAGPAGLLDEEPVLTGATGPPSTVSGAAEGERTRPMG